jgi:hypothetical protein
LTAPIVVEHEGIHVVRDDLFQGGTKARYVAALFDGTEEVVYASPAEGGAQTALAIVAGELGKRATIFVAKRARGSIMAKSYGAKVYQVSPGYLSVVQARAAAYCAATGARLAPFGYPGDRRGRPGKGLAPDEVWCAAGSGVLARGLAAAWPQAVRYVVEVGRKLSAADVAGASIVISPLRFYQSCRSRPPFPSDPHYDAKAWGIASTERGPGVVLFWNVAGPAEGPLDG